jgi:hypothetical protein
MSTTKTILFVTAAAAVGYYLLKDQIQFFASGQTQTPADTPPVVPVQTQPAASTSIRDLVAALAAGDSNLVNGRMEFNRWNFHYAKTAAGAAKPGPAIETVLPGADPNEKITVDTWWAAVSASGLSGLSSRKAWRY